MNDEEELQICRMMMKGQRVNFTANSFVPSQQRGAGYQGENLEIVSNLKSAAGYHKDRSTAALNNMASMVPCNFRFGRQNRRLIFPGGPTPIKSETISLNL